MRRGLVAQLVTGLLGAGIGECHWTMPVTDEDVTRVKRVAEDSA
jgi:hypothetical protein